MIIFSIIVLAARLYAAAWDTAPPAEVAPAPVLVVHEALRAGVPPEAAFAVAWRESRFRWWRVSGAGCVGPMQVQPRYHCQSPDCGGTWGAVRAGVGVLAEYGHDRDGLRAYNCGRGGARRSPECGAGYADSVLRLVARLRGVTR